VIDYADGPTTPAVGSTVSPDGTFFRDGGEPGGMTDEDPTPPPSDGEDGRADRAQADGEAGGDASAATDDGSTVTDDQSEEISRGATADGEVGSAADETEPGDGGDAGPAAGETDANESAAGVGEGAVPRDVQKYARFKKMDGAQYDRVNEFLRDRTYVTAREWAIARLCADFRTETGVEMTKIGENLPELVPFMTDTYTPQAVNQARASFEEKVRKSGATFLYGAMSGFFTAEELDELMYEVSEIAKFLLEVEGVDLSVEEELEAEERISSVMREVREASADLREEELTGEQSETDG
jgi:hypothetical protein